MDFVTEVTLLLISFPPFFLLLGNNIEKMEKRLTELFEPGRTQSCHRILNFSVMTSGKVTFRQMHPLKMDKVVRNGERSHSEKFWSELRCNIKRSDWISWFHQKLKTEEPDFFFWMWNKRDIPVSSQENEETDESYSERTLQNFWGITDQRNRKEEEEDMRQNRSECQTKHFCNHFW